MRRGIIVISLLVLGVTAAPALASPPGADATKSAEAACKAMRAQLGTVAFSQAFGTNARRANALGRCVSTLARVEQANLEAARAACTAEQNDPNFAATHGGKTFAQFYGTGRQGKNAFARCVLAKAKASSQALNQARMNPSRLCKAERASMGDAAFRQTHGTNANKSNAHGKCVSKLAKAQSQNELSASASCRAEQADANFAATHDGKSFAEFYGTNAGRSNAFGKCVSAKARAETLVQRQARITAARTCAAERKANAAAFRAKYRTFGRCVSTLAKTG